MTRQELKDAIRETGADVKLSGLTKDQLQQIYNRLLIKKSAPPAPPAPPKPTPPAPPKPHKPHFTPPEPDPILQPVPNPDPVPDPVTDPVTDPVPDPVPDPGGDPTPDPVDPVPSNDAFAELLGRVESAEVPLEGTSKKDKPLFEVTKTKKSKSKSSPDSMRIEGYFILLLVDTIMPASFSFINNMLDKRVKVQAHDLSLNEDQWKKLEPLADQAADYLSINLNPVAGFFILSTVLYGNNLLTVRMKIDMESKR